MSNKDFEKCGDVGIKGASMDGTGPSYPYISPESERRLQLFPVRLVKSYP